MRADKIAVVIINYKTSALIQSLINSLEEPVLTLSIFILDNETSADSYEKLATISDPRITLLKSEKNLGFTGGVNYVLHHIGTHEKNFRYFFLINPDAISCTGLIGKLANVLDNNSDAAAVSPKILYLNGDSWYAGAKINFQNGKVDNVKTNEAVGDVAFDVDVFSGCAVLFDLRKVMEAGMFNNKLFMYFDEADLSMRLKKLGHKILYYPRCVIHHDVSYTTRNVSYLKTYYMTRNKFIVFNRTMKVSNKIYFLFYELAFHLKNRRLKNALYHIKGYHDYLRGRTGPCLEK